MNEKDSWALRSRVISRCHMAQAIEDFVLVYESDDYQVALRTLQTTTEVGQNIDEWVWQWGIRLRTEREEEVALNHFRKCCKFLLMEMMTRWFEGELLADEIVHQFGSARVSSILRTVLPFDRAKTLAAMRYQSGMYGMHWVSHAHVNSEWQRLLEEVGGRPTMNKRFIWLVGHDAFRGLQLYRNKRIMKWLEPCAAPWLNARDRAKVYGTQEKEWYNRALIQGRTANNRVRILVCGPYCVGKTNLIRSLQGKDLNPQYESTIGINTGVGHLSKRTLGQDTDFKHRYNLWRWRAPLESNPDAEFGECEDAGKRDLSPLRQEAQEQNVTELIPNPEITEDATEHDELCLSAWDFGGQITYHDMHQVFFRSDCLYVLVLDLRFDSERSGPEQSTGSMLVDAFKWINAIVASTGTEIQLIVVGTHCSSFASLEEGAAMQRLSEFKAILAGKFSSDDKRSSLVADAHMVVVDNRTKHGIVELRRHIQKACTILLQQKEEIPLRWLRLLEAIENHPLWMESICVQMSAVADLAFTMAFQSTEEVIQAMSYFDLLGEVLFRAEGDLINWVFVQPQKLLDMMASLLDKEPLGLLEQQQEALSQAGYLSNHALERIWNRRRFQHQHQIREVLSATGFLMDLGRGVVIPSRLPKTTPFQVWSYRNCERTIETEALCSSHLPPNAFSFALAEMHRVYGCPNQSLSLLSRTSGSLLCLDASKFSSSQSYEGIELRLLLSFDQNRHSIWLRVGSTPLHEKYFTIADGCLVFAYKSVIGAFFEKMQQRYRWMDISFRVRPSQPKDGCFGESHSLIIPSLAGDQGGFIWKVPCHHGLQYTLFDVIDRPSITSSEATSHLFQEGHEEITLESKFFKVDSIGVCFLSFHLMLDQDDFHRWSIPRRLAACVTILVMGAGAGLFSLQRPGRRQVLVILSASLSMAALTALAFSHSERKLVFLSHTGQDDHSKYFTMHLFESMKRNGLAVFVDARSLEPGSIWAAEIKRTVQRCSVFVCIFSKTFPFRYWPMLELDLAILSGRIILPVFFEAAPVVGNNAFREKFKRHHSQQSPHNHHPVDVETIGRWLSNLELLNQIQAIRSLSTAAEAPKTAQVDLLRDVMIHVKRIISRPPNQSSLLTAAIPTTRSQNTRDEA